MANVQTVGISALALLALSASTSMLTIGKLAGCDIGWDKPLFTFLFMTLIFIVEVLLEPSLDA